MLPQKEEEEAKVDVQGRGSRSLGHVLIGFCDEEEEEKKQKVIFVFVIVLFNLIVKLPQVL